MGRGAGADGDDSVGARTSEHSHARRRELPLRTIEQVFHIGSLDPDDKGRVYTTSLEGHGLSVSLDPEAWERIAKLGGNSWWTLTRAGGPGRFVEAHALSKFERQSIADWAIEHGYARKLHGFKLSYEVSDEDGDETRYQLFNDRAEAEAELAFLNEEETEAKLEDHELLEPTAKLNAQLGMASSPVDIDDHLLVLYVDEQRPDLDGVWWDEEYASLSAPRGVLVPRALEHWQRTKISR